MMKTVRENLLYLFLTAVVVVGGYAFLRYSYRVMDKAPFTQEIVLIILGTVATMLITAMLLNKQTEVELKKEQSIKFIELKSEIYLDFIQHIEQLMLEKSVTEEDHVRLQFLTHKLAMVASPAVLEQYEQFLQVFNRSTRDESLDKDEGKAISSALALLTVKIRQDLVGELDAQGIYDVAAISQQVIDNARELNNG
ncbi:hypothetical protein [Thiolapillus brandeum]|uniref:Uncharacterized protein n=1 Tax=Thiolapillus brandeum TaxID=1076588 RepID=A0A7U6JFY7_9GAMM|nr:hypothetical protein [Thiolapillus brandeum]BAO43161.1 conserved hypothetical protein [Thiolapillus brandeum]